MQIEARSIYCYIIYIKKKISGEGFEERGKKRGDS